MDNLSLADVAAVTRDNDGFFGGSNGLIILILFFLFGMNGNGWGNNNNRGVATPDDVYNATNQQNVAGGIAGIREAICNTNMANAQNTSAIQQTLNTGFDGITAQISNLGFQMSQCCCDLKTQMLQDKYDDVRYQLEQANTAVANAVQTQNILGSLGRFVTNPPCYGGQYSPYGYLPNGTTLS